MQVEVNSAERAGVFILAEHDGDVTIQGDAVTQARGPILEGGDRLGHQRLQALEEFIGRLLHADHELVVALHRGGNLVLEIVRLQIHDGWIINTATPPGKNG